ncbi:elongator complex protein 6 [Rhinophrynus dorsalis]
MFPELCGLLGANTETVRQGERIVLCDDKADGSFLVHHFLSYYLKAGCQVCFVALVQSFSHYSIMAQKLGVNLSCAKSEGQLVFVEGLKSYTDLLFGDEKETDETNPLRFLRSGSDLKPLYEFICTALAPSAGQPWKCPVLILDDVTVLLNLGVTSLQVLNFMHYCIANVCSQYKGNLVCLVRCDTDTRDDECETLVKTLQYQSSVLLEVESLRTGFCKDVHGQLTITRWAKGERCQCPTYQYKIQDKNVSFFVRGLSAAVI